MGIGEIRARAGALEEQGRRGEARALYLRAIADGVPGAALEYACALDEWGEDPAEVERWFRAAIADGDRRAVNDLGELLSRLPGRHGEARDLLVGAYLEGDELAAGNLGHMEWADGDAAEGRRWLRVAVADGRHEKLLSLAELENEAGDHAAACRYLQRALRSGVAGAHTAYARHLQALYEDGEVVEAAFRVALERGDDEADYWFAAWLEEAERPGEALEHYRRALAGGDGDAYLRIAYVLEDLGRPEERERCLRAGMDAGDADCAVEYARLLASEDRRDEIPAVLARGVELGADAEELDEVRALLEP
ncbi:hypothetical protein [Actinomadura parmotrematis]|uniref:Tetratricopeptide repeat protein n=1 Tax=Actinomadura parmotrematis TaxID=2864039 RepID=A0ABS7FSF0_9ACTN|nr:hypothetical protein [Actinomadura parmotrematis]MBW8483334.1 hypothetical protein [Actinomadura parmotrematis]